MSGKGNGENNNSKLHNINHASKNEKVPTTAIGNTRLIWVGYILDTPDSPTDIWCQEITNNQHAEKFVPDNFCTIGFWDSI